MHDFHEVALRVHHSIDILVRHRNLVDDVGIFSALDTLGRLDLIRDGEPALCLGARHGATRTVTATLKRLGIAFAADDVRTRPHGAGNDAKLALARAYRALAGYQHLFAEMH